MTEDAGISVIIATRNRAARLTLTLESLAGQHAPAIPWDIIVADNGSTDETPSAVRQFARSSPVPVHYLVAEAPGVSHARNAATHFSSREFLAFIDDDQDIDPGWLRTIARYLREHPEVDVIGGRVLPRWVDPPPVWFTDELRGPAAIIDRGDVPLPVTIERWMCLPGGNMAWKRRTLLAVGGFSPNYPRTQDRELLVRTLLQGGHGMYAPDAIVYHRLEGDRLTRTFFRNWYRTEGRMRAGYAFDELFTQDGRMRPVPVAMPRVLGVSRHLYRRWIGVIGRFIGTRVGLVRGDPFLCELQLRQLSAYLRRRVELTAGPDASLLHRLCATLSRPATQPAASVPSHGAEAATNSRP